MALKFNRTGPFWMMVMLLLALFILINGIGVESSVRGISARLISHDGYPSPSNIQSVYINVKELAPIYQSFKLTVLDKRDAEQLFMILNSKWLTYEKISEEDIKVLRSENRTGPWEEVNINNTQITNSSIKISIYDIEDGYYVITGIRSTKADLAEYIQFNLGQQVIIGVLIILIILFLVYRHNGKHIEKQHSKQKPTKDSLNGFVKEALLSGKSEEEIAQKLMSAGWNKEDIDKSLEHARYF